MPLQFDRDNPSAMVGQTLGPTPWFQVTQAQINQFASCTHDEQFIHVDPGRAAKTPLGSTIAHGFLTLSLLSMFAQQFDVVIDGLQMGVNYGFNKVRFLTPVKVDSRVRAVAQVVDVIEKEPNQFQFTLDVSIEIEGEEKPALIAQWINQNILAPR